MVVAGVIATLCQVAAGVNTAARDVANAQRMQRGMRCCVCVCAGARTRVCGCTGAYVLARMCRCASSANCTKNQKPIYSPDVSSLQFRASPDVDATPPVSSV